MLSDKDIEHLKWLHDRMLNNGENVNADYMIKFREIINKLRMQKNDIKQVFDAGTNYATYNGRPGYEDAPNFEEWHKKWKNKEDSGLGNKLFGLI